MPRDEIPMRDRILDILLSVERQEWLSGELLSAELGISRAAVSKHIAALRDEGNIIESAARLPSHLTGRSVGGGRRTEGPAHPFSGAGPLDMAERDRFHQSGGRA